MKPALIIGNWKSNKTSQEVEEWFAQISSEAFLPAKATVIVCPPFPLLSLCKKLVEKYHLNWYIGAQDVSQFTPGKYTGEVSATLLKEYAQYVLVGHSERRNKLHETDDMLFEKVKRVKEVGLTPVFFVEDTKTPLPKDIQIVAYEPIFAIGTGTADTPEHAEEVAHYLKTVQRIPTVLYGGSVDDKNVALFMSCSSIDGIVPGNASLDPIIFSRLIQHA